MTAASSRATIAIIGMRDNACRERVWEALARIEGIRELQVSLIRAIAVVVYEAPCNPAQLTSAITDAGFGVSVFQ